MILTWLQISQYAAMRDDICIWVSPADKARLQRLVDDRNSAAKVIWRADIVLASAERLKTMAITRRVNKSKVCVGRWLERYVEAGVNGLLRDKTRPSRIKPLAEDVKLKVLAKTAGETPANATHWSRSSMAKAVGISPSSVGRIWRAADLKPHRVRTFKVSNDPKFEEKVIDVVGLYLNPPDKALVLCVDEKSQIQALDRTQPGLPPEEGPRRDHDARLQAARHDDTVCSPRREKRPRHR
jgi:transposase